jgi:2-keto-4-pentenoate hydratase/2-oxohepta-3-ene-1,7-dioic acid hydratase in catechol pathway
LLPGDVILSGKPGGVGAKRKAALADLINKKRFRSADHEKYRPVGGNVVDLIEMQLNVSCLDGRWAVLSGALPQMG